MRHTQRVHIFAQRLTEELCWSAPDTRLALCAALWHDIGRVHDGVDPWHGSRSADRAVALGLTDVLSADETDVVLFAVACHAHSDRYAAKAAGAGPGRHEPRPGAERRRRPPRPGDPQRALRILWLLKDADALDRVRLSVWESTDPAQLRHPETVALLPFAAELYGLLGP